MAKAIIFGGNGQDGIYLNQLCIQKNIEPISVSRDSNSNYSGNVGDRNFTVGLIKQHQPDFIFHFAAHSTTRHEALFENHETISTGTLNILEATREYAPKAKVLIVGSGVQFENNGHPISETDPFKADNAYAVARIQSVYAARYFRSKGLSVYVAYLFHHESPYRKPHHLSKIITDTIKRIKAGNQEKLIIGDASVEKEWAFAGDIVNGIFKLVSQDEVFEATIGTGQAYSVQKFLDVSFDIAKLHINQYVSFKTDFTPEYHRLVSNPATINQLGWHPEMDLNALAKLMLGN